MEKSDWIDKDPFFAVKNIPIKLMQDKTGQIDDMNPERVHAVGD